MNIFKKIINLKARCKVLHCLNNKLKRYFKNNYFTFDSSFSVSSNLLIVICLIVSSGKQEMITVTELPGSMLLTCSSTPT